MEDTPAHAATVSDPAGSVSDLVAPPVLLQPSAANAAPSEASGVPTSSAAVSAGRVYFELGRHTGTLFLLKGPSELEPWGLRIPLTRLLPESTAQECGVVARLLAQLQVCPEQAGVSYHKSRSGSNSPEHATLANCDHSGTCATETASRYD